MNLKSYILRFAIFLVDNTKLIPPPIIKRLQSYENKKRYQKRLPYFNTLKKTILPTTSIFCNNCFGARISQDLGYSYNSPIAGLKFPEADYLIFLQNLREFLNAPLKFKQKSKYSSYKETGYPIGSLTVDNKEVEIYFVHYKTEEEAIEKWTRRCKRVNWNDIIVIETEYPDTDSIRIMEFFNLPFKKKVYFSSKHHNIADANFFIIHELNGMELAPYREAHILYIYLVKSDWII